MSKEHQCIVTLVYLTKYSFENKEVLLVLILLGADCPPIILKIFSLDK